MSQVSKRRKLRVVYATSEVAPFSKSGGLGDVSGSLPQALKSRSKSGGYLATLQLY